MNKVIIETSARHIHLTREHIDILFGEGYQLTKKKDLSQPGQFACAEKVRVEGAKGAFPGISVLGPERKASQVEISLTDARTIGVQAPVRESGDIAGSGSCKLIGPKGEVELTEGVIAAMRHLHITPEDAAEMGVQDKQIISVETNCGGRALTFGDVVVRVSDKFATRMHIDTDEANAAGISGEVEGIVKL
ncbi:MAG: phosphate propanoyltransferase [Clostridia bacterium]|nr:phosphate propanoyltransferase [Clostridia bacterium]